MAGEWLKFEANTPDKPEVFAITAAMGWDDPDLAVGKLLRVWRWFDQQTINGHAANVTLALLDRIAGAAGFAQAMCEVGWLHRQESGVCLPHFERHNGKTAKDRALTAKRVAKHKGGGEEGGSGGIANAADVSAALPREEKKREEETKEEIREESQAEKRQADTAVPQAQERAGAFAFPLKDGSLFQLDGVQQKEMQDLYPSVDVQAELRACLGWNLANPARRKTRAGILRHIDCWLAVRRERGAPACGPHIQHTQHMQHTQRPVQQDQRQAFIDRISGARHARPELVDLN